MANHSFVTTRKKLTEERLSSWTQEIIRERFGDNLSLETAGGGCQVGGCAFWLKSSRTIEFRNPHGSFSWWVHSVIQNDLALRCDGNIRDEGTGDETWKGTPGKYPTYRDYREAMNKHLPHSIRWMITALEAHSAPEWARR